MADSQEQIYDAIAREAIEHALGRTFENPEAVPRRDAFIRDATDLLARFVAARCGNPGFHSARFFDAVIALSNARTRIRDAARRSRVVERLVEAEKRVRSLEGALRDRNEQLVQAAARASGEDDGSQLTTLARAIADADARIRTLERELSEARNRAASSPSGENPAAGQTVLLDRLDADEIFRGEREDTETTDSVRIEIPSEPIKELDTEGETRSMPPLSNSAELVLDPERRIAALKAEKKDLEEIATGLRTEKEHLELERDALQAQLDQVVQREAPLRQAKAEIARERDALLGRVGQLEKERDDLAARMSELEQAGDEIRREKTIVERDRDEVVRSRSALGELKKSVETELGLAQQERETLRNAIAEKEQARARAVADSERAHEARRAAETRIDRESTAAARARRERDELRAERDRMKAQRSELELFEQRWVQLVKALGADPKAPLDEVLRAVARRHEVVLAHEPPEWEAVETRVARLRARGDGIAAHADAWISRLKDARDRYEALAAGAQDGAGTASALLEIARIVAAHEEDRRALDLLEALAGGSSQ